MENTPRAITWEAPEHHHIEKGGDWFWALGIITIAVTAAALFFGNILFAVVLALSGMVLSLSAARKPRDIPYAVTVRGVRIDNEIYPYPTLESFYIDEDDPRGPQLLVKSNRFFMPLLVLPIPEQYIDDIESLLKEKIDEEELEEPFLMKLLEFFGF